MGMIIEFVTRWSGPAMLVLQGIQCAGYLYQGKFDTALYWAGGVIITVAALRLSGWSF